MYFVGLMPIIWTSKSQVTIEISSYSAEFYTGMVTSEEAIALQYMLSSLGVPVKFVTSLCGDNLGMIICCTNPDSELKNKHVDISYYKFRLCAEAEIVNPIKVCTTVNRSDIFS